MVKSLHSKSTFCRTNCSHPFAIMRPHQAHITICHSIGIFFAPQEGKINCFTAKPVTSIRDQTSTWDPVTIMLDDEVWQWDTPLAYGDPILQCYQAVLLFSWPKHRYATQWESNKTMQLDIKKKSTKQKQKQMKPLESTPPKQNEVEFPFMLYLPLYIFSKIVENTVCLTPNDLHILIFRGSVRLRCTNWCGLVDPDDRLVYSSHTSQEPHH